MPYNQYGQWVGGPGGGSLEAEEAVKQGLGGAKSLISNPQQVNYPGYVPSQTYGPSSLPYTSYVGNDPLARVNNIPGYQLGFGGDGYSPTGGGGLMGGAGQQNGYTPSQPSAGVGNAPNYSLGGVQAQGYQQGQGGTSVRRPPASQTDGQVASTTSSGQGFQPGMVWGPNGWQQPTPGVSNIRGYQQGQGGTAQPSSQVNPTSTDGQHITPPNWNGWTPTAAPTYGTVGTGVSPTPWSYQGIPNTDTQAAGYNWQNTPLGMQNVDSQNSQAANFNWQNTGLGMERVTNPYTKYGGTDPTYQKMGAAPAYEGMMGGDYEKLQQALTTPGEIAAKRAYEQGQTNLTNQMGGKGLYGSSIMANQQRNALEQPYMDTVATNAANAAATRYAQQATDLQNKNAFGLNTYGQQMNENQAANQMGYNTWDKRLGENMAGQGLGLQAQTANQGAFANLQGLMSQQGLAQNAAGLDYAKLQTGVNQQNASQNLQGQMANQSTYGNLQGLLGQQGLAQNAAGLDYAKLLTGVGQQNMTNRLAQNTQQNQLGLNYAQYQSDVGGDNANRALQQQSALNALRSGDTQQNNSLMGSQNLAQNQFAGTNYAQQLQQLQNMNTYGLEAARLGMTQNQNVYQAGVADAARRQDYNLAGLDYQNQANEATRQWQNAQALEPFQYNLAAGQYANNQNTQAINQYLAMAGLGAPLAQTAMNNQTASQNGWINGGLGLLGLIGQNL